MIDTMTNTTDIPDMRPLLVDSIEQFIELANATDDTELEHATPCGHYTVGELLGHVDGALERIRTIAAGDTVEGMLGDPTIDPTTIRRNLRDHADTAIAAWADGSLLQQILHPPFGPTPGAIVAIAYCSEMLVHSWDLARATGHQPTWPANDQIAIVLGGMQAALPAKRDADTPFADAVEAPHDAPVIDQLVAWSGRDPRWQPATD